MLTQTEKSKRHMAMPRHPLAEILARIYETVMGILFYGAAIGIVTLLSFLLVYVVLNALFGQVSIVFIR